MYGKGVKVEKNAYQYNKHFRRFICMEELESELENMEFKIIYKEENIGFAPNNGDDPPIIRIICEKI